LLICKGRKVGVWLNGLQAVCDFPDTAPRTISKKDLACFNDPIECFNNHFTTIPCTQTLLQADSTGLTLLVLLRVLLVAKLDQCTCPIVQQIPHCTQQKGPECDGKERVVRPELPGTRRVGCKVAKTGCGNGDEAEPGRSDAR
jgi:hypothetical protein